MFGLFKNNKKTSDVIAEDLQQQMLSCVSEIKEKWIAYNEFLKFKDDVSLGEIIEGFSIPIFQFIENKYPMLLTGPSHIPWMMIFTAVLQSNTHSKDRVNDAVEVLGKSWGNK